MDLVAVDIGSYSVKFLKFKQDRKRHFLAKINEVPVRDSQVDVVKSFLEKNPDCKVIMQIPSGYITSRYLSLPSTHKKKVDLMIPFQLDENLPFPAAEAHYISYGIKRHQSTSVLVSVAKSDEFEKFYSSYAGQKVLPSVLTGELAVIQSYVALRMNQGAFAIVDVGHETSKCYIVEDGQVISNHISHTAGKALTEVISKTYQIPGEEAVDYKHKNGFFLVEGQYQGVDQDQREFAKLMERAIAPLMLDLKRCLLGFRVKHGLPISRIYLAGGGSRMNNFKNFLTAAFNLQVEFLEDIDPVVKQAGGLQYFLAKMMFATSRIKKRPGNFLFGHYARGGDELPVHSIAFAGARVLLVCLICSFFLIIHGLVLTNQKNQLHRQISQSLKIKQYGVPKNRRRDLRRRPARIADLLEKRERRMAKELEQLQSVAGINVLGPLAEIGGRLGKSDVQIKQFTSDGKTVRAEFMGGGRDLKKLEKVVKKLFSGVELANKGKNLVVTLVTP